MSTLLQSTLYQRLLDNSLQKFQPQKQSWKYTRIDPEKQIYYFSYRIRPWSNTLHRSKEFRFERWAMRPRYVTVCVYPPPTPEWCFPRIYLFLFFFFSVLSTARIFPMIGVVHFLRRLFCLRSEWGGRHHSILFFLFISVFFFLVFINIEMLCRLFGSWRRPVSNSPARRVSYLLKNNLLASSIHTHMLNTIYFIGALFLISHAPAACLLLLSGLRTPVIIHFIPSCNNQRNANGTEGLFPMLNVYENTASVNHLNLRFSIWLCLV